ncbi:mitochondrial thiamine pyrophosphate transporter [Lunasporangiospora selenospora]|uniref:Mitochondrial thiamine pyrophosphate transporter n=1 Tax=Lunasporangiospora selenospora TaxID=979761 RepID=A0A9P6FYW0_9FUNG|nr:mitochondrial thiamine pyrophosphate transporter [Lunasporangiospora selenospora]
MNPHQSSAQSDRGTGSQTQLDVGDSTQLCSPSTIIASHANTDNNDTTKSRSSITAGTPTLSKTETVLCGATAGVVARFVIAPLDVVKIRMQGLWKGNMAAEYLYLTYSGIQFLVYQQTKVFLIKTAEVSSKGATSVQKSVANISTHSKEATGTVAAIPLHAVSSVIGISAVQSFIAGANAGIVATACTYPFDLLRTRFAIQRDVKVYTGIIQACKHIYRQDGVSGFYRGMSPALIQVVPYMGIMFGSYDTLKRIATWMKQKADTEPSYSLNHSQVSGAQTPTARSSSLGQFLLGLEDFFCGAMSGVISKTGVYPLDMVRKRLQIQGSEQQKTTINLYSPEQASAAMRKGAGASKELPNSVWRCIVHIARKEGYLALYKGLLPGLVKAAPSSAVTFLVFTQAGTFVEKFRKS